MPIDPGELKKPEMGDLIRVSESDLNVEVSGLKEKAKEKALDVWPVVKYYGLRIGLPIILLVFSYAKRDSFVNVINYLWGQVPSVEVAEEKSGDPRMVKFLGEDYEVYEKEAKRQAAIQYSLYVRGNGDQNFDLTNIPEPGQKDNVNWYLTFQTEYGITWPFASKEKGGSIADLELYPIADKQVFIDMISADLDLNPEQQMDLRERYEDLSRDEKKVLEWLNDLKNQGVPKITEKVINYYTDPVGYMTGINQ